VVELITAESQEVGTATNASGTTAADDVTAPVGTPTLESCIDPLIEFAHGTTRESGLNIVDKGLNYDDAVNAMLGSKEPGSFFTVKVNPSEPYEALTAAASWGARHGRSVSVVLLRLPQSVIESLEAARSLVHTADPVQSVFRRASFDIVNREAQWDILHVRG